MDSMHSRKKIFVILGTTKKMSTNGAIINYIAETFGQHVDIEIYDRIDQLPHFNPDLDGDAPPKIVADFRKKIKEADGVLICTPEYVFSLPGSLKNAIEWCVSTTIFTQKPVGIIVAAASGEKAYESLSLIMITIESIVSQDTKLLLQGAKGLIGPNGKIVNVEAQRKIDKLIQALILCIADENKQPTKYRK